jgi:hypothetical protein
MNDPVQKSLDDELAALSLEVAPSRNLWPAIAGRLQPSVRRRRQPMLYAAAAGLAGACVASALTWAVLHGRAAAPAAPLAAQTVVFEEPRNPSYVAARDDLAVSFRERIALLDPTTRAKIEASLAVIRRAHEDIRKALASDPASPVLEQLWQSTSRDELDLYEHVVRATQPTMTRT